MLASRCAGKTVAQAELFASTFAVLQAVSVCLKGGLLVQGACGTCAASSATMKDGIERCLEVRAFITAAAH